MAAMTASTPARTAQIVEVGCMAHARNKFKEADSTDPERVLAAKAWVRKLYDVEDEANAIIDNEKLNGAAAAAVRLRLRKEKAVPLLASLRVWLVEQKEQVLPKSPIAAAINYMLNQWDALNRYTTDGDLHIDNNISERTLKLIGMGRINWLFLGSDKGGQTAAVLFSFTATCKHLRSTRSPTCATSSSVCQRIPKNAWRNCCPTAGKRPAKPPRPRRTLPSQVRRWAMTPFAARLPRPRQVCREIHRRRPAPPGNRFPSDRCTSPDGKRNFRSWYSLDLKAEARQAKANRNDRIDNEPYAAHL